MERMEKSALFIQTKGPTYGASLDSSIAYFSALNSELLVVGWGENLCWLWWLGGEESDAAAASIQATERKPVSGFGNIWIPNELEELDPSDFFPCFSETAACGSWAVRHLCGERLCRIFYFMTSSSSSAHGGKEDAISPVDQTLPSWVTDAQRSSFLDFFCKTPIS